MKNIILILLIFFSMIASAQKIKGYIYDLETKKPIRGAHIQINDKVLITNKKGLFSFRTPKNWNEIIYITHLSYKNQKINYNGEKTLQIYIKPENKILEEVLVVGDKGKRKLEYQRLPDLPKKLHSFASVIKDNKLYVFGGDATKEGVWFGGALPGFNGGQAQVLGNGSVMSTSAIGGAPYFGYNDKMLAFDLNYKKWKKEELTFRKRANHSAINIEDKIYIIGGKRLSKNKRKHYLDEKIEVFDPITKEIKIDNTNPHRSADIQTIEYKGKLFAFGGSVKENQKGKKTYSQEVHSYNPKTGLWYLLTEIPLAGETSVCLVEDRVYFFGGFKNSLTNMIVSLNLETGKFKTEGKLFYKFEKPSVTKKDKTIYLFENGKLLTYNTKTRELKDYRLDLSLFSSTIFIQNNNLFVLGGYKKEGLSIEPQNNFLKIDLTQIPKTRARKYTKL